MNMFDGVCVGPITKKYLKVTLMCHKWSFHINNIFKWVFFHIKND